MKLKHNKKILYSFILFLLIVTFSFGTFAASQVQATTTFELVDDKSCNIELGDLAKFEKKLTNFDKDGQSATLTLTLQNLKTVNESQKPVEIFLVIDNSSSMSENKITDSTGEITRKQAVINSANTLVDQLFEANSNAKVGIVTFSSLDTMKGETEGTINDAQKVLDLSSNKNEIKSKIEAISETKGGPRTNIEAGLEIAKQNYSETENTNRYIILLTDGVPNNALDGSYETYIGTVGARTKAKLEEVENSGIDVIGVMIGLNGKTVETQSNKTYRALAEEVFGTVENPTISSYYYIQDEEIETTIVETIYKNIVSITDNSLKDITVKDYFPKEIIDNFNFEYVSSPNIGNVTQKIGTSDHSITWTIDTLKEGEIATLSYKLTLKAAYDKSIIDKILPTNEKVEISAKHGETTITRTSTDSPTVRLKTVKDDSTANTDIPQTGDTSYIMISIIAIIAVVAIVSFIYIKRHRNV